MTTILILIVSVCCATILAACVDYIEQESV